MDKHERFWSKVVAGSAEECWEWAGAHIPNGYASIGGWRGKSQVGAHRAMIELMTGIVVDAKMQVDHLCMNKGCVNPFHLEVVTQLVNTMRSPRGATQSNARKSHCDYGHPLDPDNLMPRKDSWRRCRVCAVRQARIGSEKRHANRLEQASETEMCDCGRVVRIGGLALHRMRSAEHAKSEAVV